MADDLAVGAERLLAAAQLARAKTCAAVIRTYSPAVITYIPRVGLSALHFVVERNYVDVLALFLAHGPLQLEDRDEFGKTALMTALEFVHCRCYEVLVAAGAITSPQTPDPQNGFVLRRGEWGRRARSCNFFGKSRASRAGPGLQSSSAASGRTWAKNHSGRSLGSRLHPAAHQSHS
eukprot:m.611094 g.611094  ORF g.611094 m.611094 type:complete len:177 (-) comp58137_c0_seq7:1073-1603(-)